MFFPFLGRFQTDKRGYLILISFGDAPRRVSSLQTGQEKGSGAVSVLISAFSAPMSTNINCKKPWHPSRYETQEKIKRFKEAERRRKTITREERIRILTAENEEDIEYLSISTPDDYRF